MPRLESRYTFRALSRRFHAPERGRLQDRTDRLVFVKSVKRDQTNRLDVPALGLRTLDVMKESGIGTAIVKASSVIMVEKERVLASA